MNAVDIAQAKVDHERTNEALYDHHRDEVMWPSSKHEGRWFSAYAPDPQYPDWDTLEMYQPPLST